MMSRIFRSLLLTSALAHVAKLYRLLCCLVLTMPVIGWAAGQKIEGPLAIPKYSVRPDPTDCASFPQCGGYFLYEVDDRALARNEDLCSADLLLAAYVVRCMCTADDGSLVEFYPSCSLPTAGNIEPDPDYKDYLMLLSPSCAQ